MSSYRSFRLTVKLRRSIMQHVASFSLIASFRSKADVKIMNNLLGRDSTQQIIVSSVSIGLVGTI